MFSAQLFAADQKQYACGYATRAAALRQALRDDSQATPLRMPNPLMIMLDFILSVYNFKRKKSTKQRRLTSVLHDNPPLSFIPPRGGCGSSRRKSLRKDASWLNRQRKQQYLYCSQRYWWPDKYTTSKNVKDPNRLRAYPHFPACHSATFRIYSGVCLYGEAKWRHLSMSSSR